MIRSLQSQFPHPKMSELPPVFAKAKTKAAEAFLVADAFAALRASTSAISHAGIRSVGDDSCSKLTQARSAFLGTIEALSDAEFIAA